MKANTISQPAKTFAWAQKGTTNGEPLYAIWLQSKVIGIKPSPVDMPKRLFTTMLSALS